MKIVINSCYGGFSVSDAVVEALHLSSPWEDVERTDPTLIAMVEADTRAASGLCARLRVVEIPDAATDYKMFEYDGAESIIYVLDGKMHYAG